LRVAAEDPRCRSLGPRPTHGESPLQHAAVFSWEGYSGLEWGHRVLRRRRGAPPSERLFGGVVRFAERRRGPSTMGGSLPAVRQEGVKTRDPRSLRACRKTQADRRNPAIGFQPGDKSGLATIGRAIQMSTDEHITSNSTKLRRQERRGPSQVVGLPINAWKFQMCRAGALVRGGTTQAPRFPGAESGFPRRRDTGNATWLCRSGKKA